VTDEEEKQLDVIRHKRLLEYQKKYRSEGRSFRYYYPDCRKVDCDWVEQQLKKYRKEVKK
jgi:hypothetical protein